VGFVVDKLALGQVFPEYLGFLWQFSFHRLLHTHHLPSSSGAGTTGGLSNRGLGSTPPQKGKNYSYNLECSEHAIADSRQGVLLLFGDRVEAGVCGGGLTVLCAIRHCTGNHRGNEREMEKTRGIADGSVGQGGGGCELGTEH
jgi:hypothetical protein